jgi:hypothetical protein
LVGAGAPPARASEARLDIVPKIHASTEPLQLPPAQARSVPLCLCGESVLPTFSGPCPICYNRKFPNLARRNSYGRCFDSSTAPGRPHRR